MRFPYSPRTTRPSVESPESRPGSATWGRPLCRKIRLTMRTCRAISKHPVHRQFRMFSRPCCTNGTQLNPALELLTGPRIIALNLLKIKDKSRVLTSYKARSKWAHRTVFERENLAPKFTGRRPVPPILSAWLIGNDQESVADHVAERILAETEGFEPSIRLESV
jgi:hypothetical protein